MQSLLQGKLRNQGENMGSFSLPFLSPSGYNGEKGPRDLIQNSASLANFIYCKVLPLFQLLLLTGKGLSIIWHHLGYIFKVFFFLWWQIWIIKWVLWLKHCLFWSSWDWVSSPGQRNGNMPLCYSACYSAQALHLFIIQQFQFTEAAALLSV